MVREVNGLGPSQSSDKATAAKQNQTQNLETQQQAAKTASETKGLNPKDQVNISSQAKVLAKLEARLKDVPDINLKRVEEIKNAIANGELEIDVRKLADNLLDADKDFD